MKKILHWTIVATSLIAAGQAHAYIGPGAGLSAIGSVLALIGATLLLVLGFIWYPFKRLLKRRKTDSPAADTAGDSDSITTGAEQLRPEEQADES